MMHIDGRREGSEDFPPGRCRRRTFAGADQENFQQCAQYHGAAGEWTSAGGVVLTGSPPAAWEGAYYLLACSAGLRR